MSFSVHDCLAIREFSLGRVYCAHKLEEEKKERERENNNEQIRKPRKEKKIWLSI